MIPKEQIEKQLKNTLEETNFTELGKKYRGKVRDNYILGDKRVIITTDRISAFDIVLGTIPFKGQVLNQMTCFWFEKTKHIAKNHLIENIDPNVVVAKQCKPLPVEMVIRGYITGVTKTSAIPDISEVFAKTVHSPATWAVKVPSGSIVPPPFTSQVTKAVELIFPYIS